MTETERPAETDETAEPETIRAVEWTLEAAGRLQRTVTTLPVLTQGEILVRTAVGAISPGSERSLIQGLSPPSRPTPTRTSPAT